MSRPMFKTNCAYHEQHYYPRVFPTWRMKNVSRIFQIISIDSNPVVLLKEILEELILDQ